MQLLKTTERPNDMVDASYTGPVKIWCSCSPIWEKPLYYRRRLCPGYMESDIKAIMIWSSYADARTWLDDDSKLYPDVEYIICKANIEDIS